MTSIRVRRALPRDKSAVLRLHRTLYLDHHPAVVPPEISELSAYRDMAAVLASDVDALLGRQEMRVLVAEHEGVLVGYVTARVSHDPRRKLARRAHVEDWLVLPEHRGAGLGRRLMDALVALLEEEGCEVLESSTVASNAGARAAHAELGFIETEVRMRRRLRPKPPAGG